MSCSSVLAKQQTCFTMFCASPCWSVTAHTEWSTSGLLCLEALRTTWRKWSRTSSTSSPHTTWALHEYDECPCSSAAFHEMCCVCKTQGTKKNTRQLTLFRMSDSETKSSAWPLRELSGCVQDTVENAVCICREKPELLRSAKCTLPIFATLSSGYIWFYASLDLPQKHVADCARSDTSQGSYRWSQPESLQDAYS